MASLVSKKYSDALYMVALEKNILPTLEKEVKDVKDVFTLNRELSVALCHPQLPLECKMNIVKEAFEGKVSKEIIALFWVILKKSRQELITDIFEEFIKKCNEHENISSAVVTSADKLDDSVIEKIKSEIEKKLSCKVNIEMKIDEGLIAGFKVKVNDILFDRTIDGKIKKISRAII